MKFALSSVVAVLAVALPSLAQAQELGNKGDVVFSVDRLMGITGTKVNYEDNLNRRDNGWTSISFGWRGSPGYSPFDTPRFAFDYLVAEHFSIGGALGYQSFDVDDGGDGSAFIFAPRVGYLYSFGRVVGIWPRGGLTYHSASDGPFDQKGFALNLECPFTFSPISHFAFHIGPTFDIDMFGSATVNVGGQDIKGDLTYRTFGLNAGLLGWL